jgi:hypothetical protein
LLNLTRCAFAEIRPGTTKFSIGKADVQKFCSDHARSNPATALQRGLGTVERAVT